MTTKSQDIRRIMNLVENREAVGLLEGWLDNLKSKNIHAFGDKQRREFAGRIKAEYYNWLGQTSREGDMEDLERFIKVRVGLSDEDLKEILSDAGRGADATPTPKAQGEPISQGPESKKSEPTAGPDAEEGTPLPKDLDTKMSNLGDVGIKVEKNDNHLDAGEIIDNPKAYKTSGGDWDHKKIRDKLDKMPLGAKLTLGQSSFSRTTQPTDFAESLEESQLNELDSGVLSRAEINDIMDMTAALINDKYLLNGPKNDHDDAVSDLAAAGIKGGHARGQQTSSDRLSSGGYDAQKLLKILGQGGFSKERLRRIQSNVKDASSYGSMTDQEMEELGLIGYAFLKSRS